MSKRKMTAGIILIFILGALTGVLAVQLFDAFKFNDGPHRRRTPAERTDFIMERLVDDLDLTADQATAVRPIVENAEQAVHGLKERIDPEIQAIHDRSFAAIREKLTPGQQQKFNEIRERIKRFRRRPAKP